MSEIIGASEAAGLEAGSGTERPLDDQERAVVQRLLSDPFAFPIQFKTWIVSFLEGSDILLPRSNVQGLSSLLGSGGGQGVLGLLPAGMIFPYGGPAAPVGALLCNGAPYSRTGYKRLFDAIGTAFGVGDGSTTFNVPDLRRRLPFGTGTGIAAGASDGKAEASRHIDHHHHLTDTKALTINAVGDHQHPGVGDHTHPASGANFAAAGTTAALGSGGTSRYIVTDVPFDTAGGGGHTHGGAGGHGHSGSVTIDGDTSGGFENNHPSYLAVGFIINY